MEVWLHRIPATDEGQVDVAVVLAGLYHSELGVLLSRLRHLSCSTADPRNYWELLHGGPDQSLFYRVVACTLIMQIQDSGPMKGIDSSISQSKTRVFYTRRNKHEADRQY